MMTDLEMFERVDNKCNNIYCCDCPLKPREKELCVITGLKYGENLENIKEAYKLMFPDKIDDLMHKIKNMPIQPVKGFDNNDYLRGFYDATMLLIGGVKDD